MHLIHQAHTQAQLFLPSQDQVKALAISFKANGLLLRNVGEGDFFLLLTSVSLLGSQEPPDFFYRRGSWLVRPAP